MSIKLYNTLSRQIEVFKPIKKEEVGFYACGPTVYNFAHIGNLRTYVFEDILKRVLLYNNLKVKHVINITDVGHLISDGDVGEDKMEAGAKRENKTATQIAEFYTKSFKDDLAELNILPPSRWCKATEYIKEQIKLIKTLEKKGFTYKTNDGIYFDSTKLTDYGKLAQLKIEDLQSGNRVAMGDKKNKTDFALWKFSPANSKRQMEWESPWGIGFPGWHIECSAMSIKFLGQPFDIHCGGIDHVPVHHTNEIAQSEAATGKPLANYWLHGEYLVMAGKEKMAKSSGNFLTLTTVKNKEISPLAYRYFLLQTHYRKQLTFSWEALQSAQNGLEHLYNLAAQLDKNGSVNTKIVKDFTKLINNDLYLPGALAFVWDNIKAKTINLNTLFDFDRVLGLQIKENLVKKTAVLPAEITKLINKRDHARQNKDWASSDQIRDELVKQGYVVEDGSEGTVAYKN